MASISMKLARQRLGALVEAAQRGETVTITRRGQSIAKLDPVEPESRRRLPSLRHFRATLKRRGKSLRETVDQARSQERY